MTDITAPLWKKSPFHAAKEQIDALADTFRVSYWYPPMLSAEDHANNVVVSAECEPLG